MNVPRIVLKRLTAGSPASLLVELGSGNAEIMHCIGRLDDLLAQPEPDRRELSGIRLKLSQLRLAHSPLIVKIGRSLRDKSNPTEAATLRQLQSAHENLFSEISAHTCRWTLGAVKEDWPAYAAASRELVSRWMLKLRMEEELLQPLLKKYS